MPNEPIFKIGSEGGSLCITRHITESGEVFIYHHGEFDPTGEGPGIDRSHVCKTFDEAFDHIDQRYAWYGLYLVNLHPGFRDKIVKRLIKKLNNSHIHKTYCKNICLEMQNKFQIDLICTKQPGSDFVSWSVRGDLFNKG